ncbi:GerAB/ArcD/ProY family transporter [Tepidibacter thalassicus]|uniref:Spore germination protein KB n=1 Tax=Tepidibacter thalassicus DSM 15285 TaxID=1123350 RepID=A0A1M5NRR6_9FIRM|nr:endospore germination permease [Tepidibacter thalassicus]SHG92241.1 spore germination protein KB [Tepidibacter thalassicus DSM 15285]
MNKEIISNEEAISIVSIFIIGTSTIIITGLDAKQDLWLATILAFIMAFPMILIYSRLNCIFEGKDLYDILVICFGKFIGKLIGIIYVWFAFHLASIVVRDFGEYAIISGMKDTPLIVFIIITTILIIWVLKEGIEVMGRLSQIFLIGIVILLFFTFVLLIPKMNINYVSPVLYNGIQPVIKAAFTAFSFPFSETVIFTMIFTNFKYKKSSYKIYIYSLILSSIVILITSLSTVLVLGVNESLLNYVPTYVTVSRLNIGHMLQRLEVVISFIFIVGAFIKVSICLLAACRGVAKILGYNDYKFIVTPLGLLMVDFSCLLYSNIMEFIEWSLKIWKYYAFPFQVILPIFIWIFAEIRNKKLLNR